MPLAPDTTYPTSSGHPNRSGALHRPNLGRRKPSPLVHHFDGTSRSRLARCPSGDKLVEIYNSLPALAASRRIHGKYLRNQYLHLRIIFSHLIHQVRECFQDGVRRDILPHVVRAQVHHDNVGVRSAQPAYQPSHAGYVSGEIASVAFVITVVRNSAPWCRERSNHVQACIPRADQTIPQGCTPASRRTGDGVAEGHDPCDRLYGGQKAKRRECD